MFEQFPYADMQQLNLDWIIKIAKDFLDQYTQIQQTITQGLEDLEAKKVELEAGQTKRVTVELDENAFKSYDTSAHDFVADPGIYSIKVGASVRKILLEKQVEVSTAEAAGGTACCPDGFAWAGRPAKRMTPSSIASITANTGTSLELIMTNASLLSP